VSEVWNVLRLLRWTADFFRQHGIETHRLDAELLLAHVLACKRVDLYLAFDQPVAASDRDRFRELVRRRAKERVPVAYLTGTREFWSQALRVTPDVLIPRPDTETLVRACAPLAPQRIADVGTGTGCIAIALARELPLASVLALDVSPAALAVAQENFAAAGVAERVCARQGDLLENESGPFDLIVSNPPYVIRAELSKLPPEVQHEPRLALDGGEDGLELVRRLIAQAPARLQPGGTLALEIGVGQAAAVAGLARAAGAAEVGVQRDLGGVERVVLARFGARIGP
jgi:release factor glutamine methyltransferase